MNKSIRAALVTVLLTVIMIISPVAHDFAYAEGEGAGAAEKAAEVTEIISKAGYDAASKTADAQGKRIWDVKASGEAEKCKGGVLVAPTGDLNAEAPKIKAKGAALYSCDLGQIVYGKNENEVLEPYSTTKLLTCWLALENLDPDDMVTVSKDATQAYENGTTIWLKEGEKISIRDLLYGAMLESGNDAAYALGEAVSGSEADFAELMNRTVEEWGCKDTHFVNANGWKNKKHYTTAHDMAIITAKCLESPELREIAMTKKYTGSETNMTEAREMKNYFLHTAGYLDGLIGGKTGTWEDDDCSIVAGFSEGGLQAVAVVLCDTKKGRPADLRKLMTFAHEVTPGFIVPAEGTPVTEVRVKHGEKTKTALVADALTFAYPAENDARDIRTEVKHDKLEAPIKKGTEAGTILVYADNELIAEHKLLTTEDIDTGWLPSYIYISNRATLNAIIVIGVFIVLLLFVSWLGRRISRNRKKRKRNKKSASASPERRVQTESKSKERPVIRDDETGTGSRMSSRKEKKEARKRLREKYRGKH